MEKNTLIWALYCKQCKKTLPILGTWDDPVTCPGCHRQFPSPSESEHLFVHCTGCKKWNIIKRSETEKFECPCCKGGTKGPSLEKEEPPALIAGRYALLQMIGSGLAGQVWTAEDRHKTEDPKIVAIKFVKEGEGSQILRAEREAQVLAQLNHPGIIHVHGYLKGPGFPLVNQSQFVRFDFSSETACIIMEYVPGGDLHRWTEEKQMSSTDVARLFIPIYDALQAIHDAGIVHRDLKLANILMKEDSPIVTDFGLSRLIGSTSITAKGTIMGSLDYMSPEQARGKTADQRSDLYATGAMMWRMIFRKSLYASTSPLIQLRRIIRDPIPSDIEILPPTFQYILSKLLSKVPGMRFQNAREVHQALLYFIEEQESLALESCAPTDSVPEPSSSGRKSTSIIVAPPLLAGFNGTETKSLKLVARSARRSTKRLLTIKEKKSTRILLRKFLAFIRKSIWSVALVSLLLLALLVLAWVLKNF